jgi:hypothetical protein
MKTIQVWLDNAVKVSGAIAFLALAVAAVFAVLVYRDSMGTIKSAVAETPTIGGAAGKPVPVGGTVGAGVVKTSNTVWTSVCPQKTVPISGTCIVLASGSAATPPLQNVGASGQEWQCAWSAPVQKADVVALCLKTQ